MGKKFDSEKLKLSELNVDLTQQDEEDAEKLIQGNSEKKSSAGPSDLTLARGWKRLVEGRYAYFDSEEWMYYKNGIWRDIGDSHILKSIQDYLIDRKKADKTIPVNKTKILGVEFMARAMLGPHMKTKLNKNTNLVCLKNGVYDLDKEMNLDHNPEYWMTYQLPFAYDAAATCPRWEQFLTEVMRTTGDEPCQEWIDLLQEWYGYCLIPDVSIQMSMFWVGGGNNGKGVATRVLQDLFKTGLEPHFCDVPLMHLDKEYTSASFQGKMVGFVNEPKPQAMQKNGEEFKKLTGEDPISARNPRGKRFTYLPTMRIIVSCNNLPNTSDLSHGYFRRVCMIEWRRRFEDAEVDTQLGTKLRAELPGIFNWCLVGLKRLRENGMRIEVPEESKRLLAEYKASQDIVGQFVEDACDLRSDYKQAFDPLYQTFARWVSEHGEYPISANRFGRRLTDLGFASTLEGPAVNRFRSRNGLRLRTPVTGGKNGAVEHEERPPDPFDTPPPDLTLRA